MDGIDLILEDHERVNAAFAEFDETHNATLIGQVLDMLIAHDDAEQAALYPLAQVVLGDSKLIAKMEHAHSAVKKQMDFIKFQEGKPLVEAFLGLRELVTAHVQDEETKLLPALRKKATEQQLQGLGARILQVKQRVG